MKLTLDQLMREYLAEVLREPPEKIPEIMEMFRGVLTKRYMERRHKEGNTTSGGGLLSPSLSDREWKEGRA